MHSCQNCDHYRPISLYCPEGECAFWGERITEIYDVPMTRPFHVEANGVCPQFRPRLTFGEEMRLEHGVEELA